MLRKVLVLHLFAKAVLRASAILQDSEKWNSEIKLVAEKLASDHHRFQAKGLEREKTIKIVDSNSAQSSELDIGKVKQSITFSERKVATKMKLFSRCFSLGSIITKRDSRLK